MGAAGYRRGVDIEDKAGRGRGQLQAQVRVQQCRALRSREGVSAQRSGGSGGWDGSGGRGQRKGLCGCGGAEEDNKDAEVDDEE